MTQRVSDGTTHWEGCERHHLACALARLEKCEAGRDEACRKSEIDERQCDHMTDLAAKMAGRLERVEAECAALLKVARAAASIEEDTFERAGADSETFSVRSDYCEDLIAAVDEWRKP